MATVGRDIKRVELTERELWQEGPPHEVSLRAFFLHQREVSAGEYAGCVDAGACSAAEVMGGGGYYNYGRPERQGHPVNGVTWNCPTPLTRVAFADTTVLVLELVRWTVPL